MLTFSASRNLGFIKSHSKIVQQKILFCRLLLSTAALGNCSLVRIIPLKTFLLMDLFLLEVGIIAQCTGGQESDSHNPVCSLQTWPGPDSVKRRSSSREINTKYGTRAQYRVSLIWKESLFNKVCTLPLTSNQHSTMLS